MAKVILICGKLCSGKSTYAEQLRTKNGGVILSVDQLMLALFGQYAGDRHDEYVSRIKGFLLDKSAELLSAGVNVILDWGFWTKAERKFTREFYRARGLPCEAHFIDVSNQVWKQRLDHRNALVSAGESSAYFVDEALAEKFGSLFEPPEDGEIDLWIRSL